jgi:arylsulfatase A-like enzyme
MAKPLPRCAMCLASVALLWAAAVWATAVWATALPAAEPERLSVVLILLDNVGQEWFGCYGSEENCTPNIDRLAESGVRVENCYASPVCGPSRTMLLTGRYPHTTGFRLHHDAALYSGGGLDPAREIVFPRLFREAGYATGITGKWQINNLYDEPDALTRHGFGEHLVWPGSINRDTAGADDMQRFAQAVRRESYDEAVALNRHIESRYWNPVFIRNGRRETLAGKFGPDQSHAFAIDFVRRHRERPFFLYLPMVLTHGQSFTENVVPTPANRDAGRPHHEMFADMLRYADARIGELIAELDRLGLREKTIIIVASDNGTEKSLQARRNGRLVQGDLYALTEAGGNVVLLANCPRRIPGGRTIPLADFTDVYPTLCELAGVPLSDQHRPDGQSCAAYLLGRPGAVPPRAWILNEYHQTRVVRDTRFKLYSDGRLYDANADPAEQHNLSASGDAATAAARQRLQAVLHALPADRPPPFPLRSLSAFKIRGEAGGNGVGRK